MIYVETKCIDRGYHGETKVRVDFWSDDSGAPRLLLTTGQVASTPKRAKQAETRARKAAEALGLTLRDMPRPVGAAA